MNIFEQYGIQEVADVTLYSIELDENDDEIYVPILYLDTLKISTLEGTSEQVSARGGLGNPELITWDYGKEITVTLQDALYTPASQSLTWGGQYGSKNLELYGTFTPFIYNKDKYGRTIYLNSDGGQADFVSGKVEDAKVIIESFSDFYESNLDKDNTLYDWLVNLKVISNSTGERYYKEKNIGIEYNAHTKGWKFINSGENQINSTSTINVTKRIKNQSGTYTTVIVGTFTLSNEKNKNVVPPEEAIYQIKSGLNNVYYLDRMEKCRATQTFVINTDSNLLHHNYSLLEKYSQCPLTVYIDPKTMKPYEPNTDEFCRKNGEIVQGHLRVIKQYEIYYKWTRSRAIDYTSLGHQIVIDAVHFPGTYRLVGETYARSRKTGKDHRYQFEIPLCKMSSDTNLTLEAGGEPTTFDMTLKVLRREDGTMMKLTQYSVEKNKYDGYLSDSTYIVPIDEVVPEDPSDGSD